MLAISKEYIISFVDQILLWTEPSFTGEVEMWLKGQKSFREVI